MDKELLIRKKIASVELKFTVDVYKNVHWVYFFPRNKQMKSCKLVYN